MQSVNPKNGEVLNSYEEDTPDEVERKLRRAAATFPLWRTTPLEERAAKMRRAAALLRDGSETYAKLMTDEMGKPIQQARSEVEKCAWVCDYYADEAGGFLAPQHVATDGSDSFVRFDPLGVVLAVMPWNFPFWQVFRFAAPGLMAGNVGLLKHASNVPGCALAIEELFTRAGFPQGAFTSLLVGASAVEGLIRDPRVAAATLTGSEPAGRSVASIAGSEIKPTVLELGGSDAFVVLSDADVEPAMDAAITARTINSGQSCIAAKRFIVSPPHYDRFVEGVAERLAKLRTGDPLDEATDVGPLARPDLVADLHAQVEASVRDGARLVLGGAVPEGPGSFYPPTLLVDCTREVEAFRDETFGPVLAVAPAADDDEAIGIANDSGFGLGASVWTSAERGKELASRIESGHVAVNGIVKSDPRLPFGGIKRSGYGRELSRYGMLEFVNIKSVWVA
ncbi:MAG: aldehyde dehydrogenase family protein [Dehalococcoidia bacterium]|nr:aldehyde dehydrogenase family protein [Dehalococcoidia bacterium]